MKVRPLRRALLGLFILAVPAVAAAYNPALEWYTISTEHFDVHYHAGEEWTASQVAEIAEEIHPYITGLYNYDPGRCHFVILDDQDYANGAAFYYDNKIEIWATNLEFGLRGTGNWLRNVVTHEYTHVVSIQAAMKFPVRIPAFYFQVIGFEDEKRPDVLTGYPNTIASYPIAGTVVPPWWAEGVSQYQSPDLQYDCWDSHRDMILREGVVDGTMLTYDQMGFFGHGTIGNEEVYDHGYGLVRYIAATYGPDSIRKISEALGDIQRLTIDGALKKVTGKSGKEIYGDWIAYLRARYDGELAGVRANPREGWVLSDAGYWTVAPTLSPDGSKVALLSNKGSDYASTSLYLVDRKSGAKLRRIEPAVSSRASFSPDGKKLVYGKHVRQNLYGSMRSDIYVYDLEKKKETRITKDLRAAEASFSPDGNRVVFVVNGDGTHRLVVAGADGKNQRVLLQGEKGTQYFGPQFSPDGTRVLFGAFASGTRDIAVVDTSGAGFRWVLRTPNDERDARWTPGGDGVVFASDRTGIFNVYTMDLTSGEVTQRTNVEGGAFYPDLAGDGAIVYSQYTGKGYRAAVLDGGAAAVATLDGASYARHDAGPYDECADLKRFARSDEGGDAESFETSASVASLDTERGTEASSEAAGEVVTPHGETGLAQGAHKYKRSYTNFQLYPRFVVYDGNPRLGAFIASNEILDKQSFFAGGSYGTNKEYDGFIMLEFRQMLPVLYMDFFGVREFFDDQVSIEDILYKLDIRYDLWSADMGLRFEFEDPYAITVKNDVAFWYSHSEYKVHIDPFYRNADDPNSTFQPEQAVGWKYFIGNDYYAQWHYKAISRAIDSDINPRGGREFTLQYMRAEDELFTSGEFEYGFNPNFDKNSFNQYTLDWKEYLALPWWNHSLQIRLKGSVIDRKVDDFFHIYMGGMDGIRGYTYYSIGGRRGVLGSATYRFPIWRRIDKQLLNLTLKDIYGGVFFESANAWNKTEIKDYGYKKSVGYEVRLNMGSFYSYPTTVNFVSAYPLNDVVFFNPVFTTEPIVNDKKWRYYLTVGFTF